MNLDDDEIGCEVLSSSVCIYVNIIISLPEQDVDETNESGSFQYNEKVLEK